MRRWSCNSPLWVTLISGCALVLGMGVPAIGHSGSFDPLPIPSSQGRIPGWIEGSDNCSRPRPDASDTPRACSFSVAQTAAPTGDVALRMAIERWKLRDVRFAPIEPLEVMREVFGAPAFIVSGTGKLGDKAFARCRQHRARQGHAKSQHFHDRVSRGDLP